jgi:uncharacterized protein YjdB
VPDSRQRNKNTQDNTAPGPIAALWKNGIKQALDIGNGTLSYATSVFVAGATGGVPVTGVSLNRTAMSMSMSKGDSDMLTVNVQPSNATNKAVTWTSDAPSIASVSAVSDTTASVSALGAGMAYITVTTDDGGYTAKCTVIVNTMTTPVTGVTLDTPTVALRTGGTTDLAATIQPGNATDKVVSWATSDPSVATVVGAGLNAMVTAVGAGAATITVTTQDGGKTVTCVVTVSSPAASTSVYATGIEMVDGAHVR